MYRKLGLNRKECMQNYKPFETHFQGKENVQDNANIQALSKDKIQ